MLGDDPLPSALAAGGAGGAGGTSAFATAPGAIRPRTAPTATVSPSAATISVSSPVAGAGTSTSTLSVVTSTRASPSLTLSPTALSQRDTIPSVTDSPIAGRVSETGSATLESSHLLASAVRLAVDCRRPRWSGRRDIRRHGRRRGVRWHRWRDRGWIDHRGSEILIATDRRGAAGQDEAPVG